MPWSNTTDTTAGEPVVASAESTLENAPLHLNAYYTCDSKGADLAIISGHVASSTQQTEQLNKVMISIR